MKDKIEIKTYEQLKAISDPLRVKIITYLIENAYTGKQLGEILETSPSKIHYHLKELEQVGLIEIVKTETKNGILQKFYKSVGYSLEIDDKLLPHMEEIKDSLRESMYMITNRAKSRILSAPEEAFKMKSSNYYDNPIISTQTEVKLDEEKFIEWKKKFYKLLEELGDLESEDGKWFYLAHVGFQIETPLFVEQKEEK